MGRRKGSKNRPKDGERVISTLITMPAKPEYSVRGRGAGAGRPRQYETYRELDRGRMVELVLSGKSYADVAKQLKAEREELGQEYGLTAMMVKLDVEGALEEWRATNYAELNRVVDREMMRLSRIGEELQSDYEKSKKADAKAMASMLRTLMGSGMSFADARAEIDGMEFAGSPDIQRVRMENIQKRLKLAGAEEVGKKVNVGTNNNIVNYNFKDVDATELKALARSLQDAKYSVEAGVRDVEAVAEEAKEQAAADESSDLGLDFGALEGLGDA